MDFKRNFTTIEEGTEYQLPVYEVIDGKGIEVVEGKHVSLNFVRGSKAGDEVVEKREGTLHEHLLSAMIADLQFKNKLVPSREGSLIITNLQQARLWMHERQIDRISRDVAGTYKK